MLTAETIFKVQKMEQSIENLRAARALGITLRKLNRFEKKSRKTKLVVR